MTTREADSELRKAYLALANDDERRGFLDGMMDASEELADGAWYGLMEEVLGEDWDDELYRLGLWSEVEDDDVADS